MKGKKIYRSLSVLFLLELLLVQWASHYPLVVETYYATRVYPVISGFLRVLLGWIPFSVGDLFLLCVLMVVFRFGYLMIKTRFKQLLDRCFQIGAFLGVLYGAFYLFWGLNYYRVPLAKQLAIPQHQYSTEQLVLLSERMIDSLHRVHTVLVSNDSLQVQVPYTAKDFYKLAPLGYEKLSQKYPSLSYHFPSIKSSLMSTLQSYNGTSGYLNPFTGEAQVNAKIPKSMYATTVSHEMAHQLGYAAENEANFVGFLAASHHTDPYFRYSAYRMATQYAIYELYKRDPNTFKELYATIHIGVKKDFVAASTFWNAYKNPFEPIVKKGYNAYLKANNQANGISSYNYVVDLLIGYYSF